MKKKFLSLFLAIGMILGAALGLVACGGDSKKSESKEPIDYAASVTLDMENSLTMNVTVKSYIDGDTTHFYVPEGTSFPGGSVLKARYLAVNTPESTGAIEEWGKCAARFTSDKLKSAESIVLQADGDIWEADSTGERYLVWVWYKTADSATYRNLNIEILQNGLAVGSKSSATRYGSVCVQAVNSASEQKLHIHSSEPDPDYYYGAAQEVDLKELRTNLDSYKDQRVAFEGVITNFRGEGVYVEDYDEETGLTFGMYIYYGYTLDSFGKKIYSVGNRIKVVGVLTYWETGQSWQVSDVKYNAYLPDDPDNTKLLDNEKHAAQYTETSVAKYMSDVNVTITKEDESGSPIQSTKTLKYVDAAQATTISMKNLKVTRMYTTTNNDSDDKGAITLYCEVDGKEVIVRTSVLKNADNTLVTESTFANKTIDVQGVLDTFSGEAQIRIFSLNSVTFH